jgi:hypothetical protein
MPSDRSLERLQDSYEKERIFLIGNGPSLDKTPLDELIDEYTLGMKGIYHIYSNTEWRPTFYYNPIPSESRGRKRIMKVYDSIESSEASFLHRSWRELFESDPGYFYFDRWQFDRSPNPFHNSTINEIRSEDVEYIYEFWSDNIANFVYHYHSMYGAIQLAAYLGFDEIYLLGCDLGFEYLNPHMIFNSGMDPNTFVGNKYSYIRESIDRRNLPQSLLNAIAMKLIRKFGDSQILMRIFNQGSKNHFTSDYVDRVKIRDGGKSEDEIRKSHVAAKKICQNKGIDIYNATLGGELDVYERKNLREVI